MQKITHAHCNNCGGSTNHGVIATDKHENNELYEMLKCLGCNCVVMRHTFYMHTDKSPTVVLSSIFT